MRKQLPGGIRSVKREHVAFPTAVQAVTSSYRTVFETTSAVQASQVDSFDELYRKLSGHNVATTTEVAEAVEMLRGERDEERNVFSVETLGGQTFDLDALDYVNFPGVYIAGETLIQDATYGTSFRPSRKTKGSYRFSCHLRMNHDSLDQVVAVHAYFLHNLSPVRPLTPFAAVWSGNDGFPDIITSSYNSGTCVLHCEPGDFVGVGVVIQTNAGLGGTEVYNAGSELFGYFDGERVKCDGENVTGTLLPIQADGITYPIPI